MKVVSGCGEALLNTDDGHYTYAFNGADPLQLGLRHNRINRADSLKKTAESPFPDALEQLRYLFQSDRTGDIIVTAKPGYDLRGWREFPEHRSSHGALCKEHMAVPILSNVPLSAISDGAARTVDLFPTVVEGLGLSPDQASLRSKPPVIDALSRRELTRRQAFLVSAGHRTACLGMHPARLGLPSSVVAAVRLLLVLHTR